VADDAHLAPQPSLNPDFVAMPATEIVAHLNRHRRRDDFADAALVFAARDRRLAEAEQLVRVGDKRIDRLLEGIKARDAQIHQAAVTEERMRAEIRALQQPRAAGAKARPLQQSRAANAKARARHCSGPSGCGLTQQVVRASKRVRYAARVDTMPAARGEVGGDVPRTTRYRARRMNASSAFPSSGDETEGFDTGVNTTSNEGEVGDDGPRYYRSLRMNASTGFPSRSARLAKQPRRRS